MIFGLFDSPWQLLGLAGWCFLMGWGFRIGLLRMALSLGALSVLIGLAWLFKDAETPALVYGPLVFVGVVSVISVGIFGRQLEQRLGYGSTAVRFNHAGGSVARVAHWCGSLALCALRSDTDCGPSLLVLAWDRPIRDGKSTLL